MAERPLGPLPPSWRPDPRHPRNVAILADLLARYAQHEREGTLPRGGRGMFYDLRPAGFGNGVIYVKPDSARKQRDLNAGRAGNYGRRPMEASPENVGEVLRLARRAGLIPENWVADTRAPDPMMPGDVWRDAEEFAAWVADCADSFRLDLQRGQPCYIEVLCEAEDLMGRLSRVAGEYGVPVYSGAGFGGIKGKRAFAGRAARRDVPAVVLQVTDLDTAGGHIAGNAEKDAVAWARESYDCEPGWLTFERIALAREQAERFSLLDEAGKAEVDGIPVREMDQITREAIEGMTSQEARDRELAGQEAERGRVPAAVRAELENGL